MGPCGILNVQQNLPQLLRRGLLYEQSLHSTESPGESYSCYKAEWASRMNHRFKQETQLSPRDRAMRRVN